MKLAKRIFNFFLILLLSLGPVMISVAIFIISIKKNLENILLDNSRIMEKIINNSIILAIVFIIIALSWLVFILNFERRKTKLLKSEREFLRQSEERYRLLEQLSDGIIFECDLYKDYIRFNRNYEKVFERHPFLTKKSDLILKNPYIHESDYAAYELLVNSLLSAQKYANTEFRVIGADGEYIWMSLEVLTLFNEKDMPYRIIGKCTNIDEQKKKLQLLQFQAQCDSLTKLFNHEATVSRINTYLESDDGNDSQHALLIIDIDDFKNLNDTFGHQIGDYILQTFAVKLKNLFRTTDIVGRIGGDEFAVFLKDLGVRSYIASKAQDICDLMTLIASDPKINSSISCSIGITIFKKDGSTFETLYPRADDALYAAKAAGKNCYQFSDITI